MKKQFTELEKAFVTASASVAPDQKPSAQPQQRVAEEAAVYVQLALSAVSTNDYAASVIALQEITHVPGLTAEQLIAVERTKQAMTAELVSRAARGDSRAKAELAAIEKTLSQ